MAGLRAVSGIDQVEVTFRLKAEATRVVMICVVMISVVMISVVMISVVMIYGASAFRRKISTDSPRDYTAKRSARPAR